MAYDDNHRIERGPKRENHSKATRHESMRPKPMTESEIVLALVLTITAFIFILASLYAALYYSL